MTTICRWYIGNDGEIIQNPVWICKILMKNHSYGPKHQL